MQKKTKESGIIRTDLQTGKGNRILWLDVARTMAILSVTFNHALSRSFDTHIGTLAEYQSIPKIVSLIKAILYVFSRGGVPWFLMITAVLLLPRDYTGDRSISVFLKRNWLPLFITSEIWLAIIFFYLALFAKQTEFSGIGEAAAAFVQNQLFINQTTFASMWYLPMILTVYLMIPVFSVSLKMINSAYFRLLLIAAVLVGMIIPNINTILSGFGVGYQMESAVTITDLFSIYVIYLLCGYFIGEGALSRMKDHTVLFWAAAFFILTSLFQYWTYSTQIDYFVRYEDIGILLFSVFMFEYIRRKGNGIKNGKKLFTFISRIAFAIYFVHVSIMYALNTMIRYLPVEINYLPKFFFLEFTAVFGAIVFITLLARIEVFRRYLFLIKD